MGNNNQGNILVNDQVLMDTASTYRNNISKMRSLLDEATRNINKTSSNWSGEAAEGLRMKYEKFKATFDPFCESVEQFAKFLDSSAEQYRINEANVKKAAEEAISDVSV
ncbi:MAG: WXG100 family type VII secretion target [Bacilli bacterium]|nr:WXG100 family type VII secretion target [Bacilli bacterium]